MFTWFVLFTILQMLFSFPSLLAGLLMLVSDRVLGTVIFSLPVSQGVAAGGSVLWDDVFWFFGHPEVYVVLLPGFGIIRRYSRSSPAVRSPRGTSSSLSRGPSSSR